MSCESSSRRLPRLDANLKRRATLKLSQLRAPFVTTSHLHLVHSSEVALTIEA